MLGLVAAMMLAMTLISKSYIGFAFVALFALVAYEIFARSRPDRVYLELTEEGVRERLTFRTRTWRWQDISTFRVIVLEGAESEDIDSVG